MTLLKWSWVTHVPSLLKVSSLTRVTSVKSMLTMTQSVSQWVSKWTTSVLERLVTLKTSFVVLAFFTNCSKSLLVRFRERRTCERSEKLSLLGSENFLSEKHMVRLLQRMALFIVLLIVKFSSTQWRRKQRSFWKQRLRIVATTSKKLFVTRLRTGEEFCKIFSQTKERPMHCNGSSAFKKNCCSGGTYRFSCRPTWPNRQRTVCGKRWGHDQVKYH